MNESFCNLFPQNFSLFSPEITFFGPNFLKQKSVLKYFTVAALKWTKNGTKVVDKVVSKNVITLASEHALKQQEFWLYGFCHLFLSFRLQAVSFWFCNSYRIEVFLPFIDGLALIASIHPTYMHSYVTFLKDGPFPALFFFIFVFFYCTIGR